VSLEYVFGDITVPCTNADRIVYPDAGITKGDVIAYCHSVADVMIPELSGRPLTIERFTKGRRQGWLLPEACAEALLCAAPRG